METELFASIWIINCLKGIIHYSNSSLQSKKANRRWIEFVTGSKISTKVNSTFSCKVTTLRTRIPLLFAWLKRLHNTQSSVLETETNAKIICLSWKMNSSHGGGPTIRVLSVVTMQKKIEFTFVEILEPVTN